MVRRLLLWMANPQLKDEYFEKNLTEVFAKHVIETRREWSERRKGRIKELANANSDLTPAQVRAVFDADWTSVQHREPDEQYI